MHELAPKEYKTRHDLSDFVVPTDQRLKQKGKKRISTSTLVGTEKKFEHDGDDCINCNWCLWYCNKRFIERTGGL